MIFKYCVCFPYQKVNASGRENYFYGEVASRETRKMHTIIHEKDAHYNSQEKILAYYHTLILILSEHLLLVVFTVEFQD